jgi:hypothetical protein
MVKVWEVPLDVLSISGLASLAAKVMVYNPGTLNLYAKVAVSVLVN